MKWLITGGCGFIGTNLIEFLSATGGESIRVIDNLSSGSREALSSVSDYTACDFNREIAQPSMDDGVQLIVGDILDEKLALRATRDVDIVVHLAANTGVGPSVENPRVDCLNNVLGTFNYLEAARKNGTKRFVFASSGAPIGECTPPIHEELAPHPVSPYGASKLAGEGYCSAYARAFGLSTVALRFGNVYGPRSSHKGSVVAKFIRMAMAGETLEIYGDGAQTRDFVYVGDLVRAIEKAGRRQNIGGEIFQIATSAETTVLELVDILVPTLSEMYDLVPNVVHGPRRVGDVMRNFSDTSKAKAKLDWEAQISLNEGLRRTVAWYIEQQHVVDDHTV